MRLAAVTGFAWLAACGGDGPSARAPMPADPDAPACRDQADTVDVEEEQPPAVSCPSGQRQLLCFGSWAAHCDGDGELVELVNCREREQTCAARRCADAEDCRGCHDCRPGHVICGEDGERLECDAEGRRYEVVETCDESAGERCSLSSGRCEDLCQAAEDARSYIGCEYWAVPTRNSQLAFAGRDADGLCQPFSFALVVANPQGVPAEVTIESPGSTPVMHRIGPGDTASIDLPCSPVLKGDPTEEPASTLTQGAHRVRSTVPVTIYQFNPLEFESDLPGGTPIFSHTNDASLLLPTHVLTGRYAVMSLPTLQLDIELYDEDLRGLVSEAMPGFVAVIGVDPEPTRVVITSSAYTRPSEDGAIPALSPGDRLELTLGQGEVLQLLSDTPDECDGEAEESTPLGSLTYCEVSQRYDLTGTRIEAEGRVSVIAGHDCTFLPRNRWACDHVEETMFPVESWGEQIWVSRTEGIACQPDTPNMVRVLSDSDGNRLNFVPEVHEPVTLNAGDYVQFEYTEDFRVSGSGALMVAQFLLGQDYEGRGSSGSRGLGDPALSLGIPFEQWRNSYAFIAPESFTLSYINVIAREGQLVLLDGRALSGFHGIEDTPMATARVAVEGGEHRIESEGNFGILVYGYAPYTSYMVPGGLDLNLINRPD